MNNHIAAPKGLTVLSSSVWPSSHLSERSLLEVELAMAALQRGFPVLLRSRGGAPHLLVQPVEGLIRPAIARFEQLASGPVRLAVTAERLHHLGLATSVKGRAGIIASADKPIVDLALELGNPLTEDPARLGKLELHRADWPERFIEAAVTLPRLAGLMPTSLIAAASKRLHQLRASDSGSRGEFEAAPLVPRCEVDADAVLGYEENAAAELFVVTDARVPLGDAEVVRLVAFRGSVGGPEHLALVIGKPDLTAPVLVRLHSSCLTGDVLGSLRCDCGQQLRGAIRAMADGPGGVLLYLAQEGRGIGLVNKLRAYQLQDRGFDTVDANERLGFAADERVYAAAAAMLRALKLPRIQLMTNNPDKVRALEAYGIDVVRRVPHAFPPNDHNRFYLETKALRSGHLLRGMALGNGADAERA
jgi:GTP cyclohydrolase II